MLISELAEKVGLHPETIRRLERRGIITSQRDINNWRHYPRETIDILRKRYALIDILADQGGEVVGLRGEIEKGPPPRRKR